MRTKSPGRQSSRTNSGLQSVVLHVTFKGRSAKVIGALFAKTRDRVVLLNHLRKGADVGRLKKIRLQHISPEADIYVFPRSMVKNMRFLR